MAPRASLLALPGSFLYPGGVGRRAWVRGVGWGGEQGKVPGGASGFQ